MNLPIAFVAFVDPESGIIQQTVFNTIWGPDAPLKTGDSLLKIFASKQSADEVLSFFQQIGRSKIPHSRDFLIEIEDKELTVHVMGQSNGANQVILMLTPHREVLLGLFPQLTKLFQESTTHRLLYRNDPILDREPNEGELTELMNISNELANLHRDMAKQKRNLDRLNVQKNMAMGMLAHDLRNPIGAIIQVSEQYLQHPDYFDHDSLNEWMTHFKESCRHMLHMIEDLLDFSKLESGSFEIEQAPFSMTQLVKSSLIMYRGMAKDKDMQLQWTEDENEESLFSLGEAGKINQVISNFINNAIKYSEAGDQIIIELKCIGDRIRFSVTDHGQGISNENQRKLFQPYQTVGSKTTAGEKSTGLGLAICKNIIDAHEGEIGVESVEREYTTFFFELPLIEATSSDTSPESPPMTPSTPPTKPKILIVDDIAVNIKVTSIMIKDFAGEILSAPSGEEALEKIDAMSISAAILDINLDGGMDGFELCRQLKELNPDLITIGLTGNFVDAHLKSKADEAGFEHIVSKPIKKAKLLELLDQED